MNNPNYQLFHLKITLLTPLHIGNGREMRKDYDYTTYEDCTWRINEDALLEDQKVEDPKAAAILARARPADLLRKHQDFYDGSPYFRYILVGTPKSAGEGAALREQIKDVFGRPYIPGSTIKGAFRTALASYLWNKNKLSPSISKLKLGPKSAASNYEEYFFGEDPNHDLLRALQVSDSAPLEISSLMLVNARVLTQHGKPGSPVELEALRRHTVAVCKLKLDSALFSQWAKDRQLILPNADCLINFISIIRDHSLEAAEREKRWAESLPDGNNVISFYKSMLKFDLHDNAAFVQLGWGGGWEQKTLGVHLKKDEAFMRAILKSREEGGWDVGRGKKPKFIKDFPVSRRIAMAYLRNAQGEVVKEIPALPFGWALLELEQIK